MKKHETFDMVIASNNDIVETSQNHSLDVIKSFSLSYRPHFSIEGSKHTELYPSKVVKDLSERTQLAYKASIHHFQFTCGFILPSTPEGVMAYLELCSSYYAPDTLKARLSALSHWHKRQRFSDPTEDLNVKALMYQISLASPHQPKRTNSFTFDHLKVMDQHFENLLKCISISEHCGEYMRVTRDRAMFMVAFWRGLGTTELGLLNSRDIQLDPIKGLRITAFDRGGKRTTKQIPWRPELCAASAIQSWVKLNGQSDSSLFQKIEKNGDLSKCALLDKSIPVILQRRSDDAGLSVSIGAHSFRRGFGEWARDSDWDIQSILEYVGWNGLNRHLAHLSKRRNSDHQTD